jgi:hypothetical protein
MEMDDIILVVRKISSQLQARYHINRIPNPQRMTDDSGRVGTLPELAPGIADQIRAMTRLHQGDCQSEHLRLATAEAQFRIDTSDSQ